MKIKPLVMRHLFFLGFSMLLVSCLDVNTDESSNGEQKISDMDIHSFAKPAEAVIKHLSLDLTADFENKKLSGTASYDISVSNDADSIYLDTRGLDIHSVTVNGVDTKYTLGENKEWLGQALAIPVE